MDTASMKSLIKTLEKRASGGCPVQFWLRDDDAIEPTKPLDRLLDLCEQHGVPVTLAVIPALSGNPLVSNLAPSSQVAVAVHGWSHQNYAPASEKKQELGLHRPLTEVVAELERGYADLEQRHTEQFVPLLVPPWNRIDAAVIQALPGIGFTGLSTFGAQTSNLIPMINTHVDLIDWRGSRGGRPTTDLANEIVNLIQNTRTPIGILGHHLVHDDNAWQFLEQLFAATVEHEGASWVPISHLLPDPRLPSE